MIDQNLGVRQLKIINRRRQILGLKNNVPAAEVINQWTAYLQQHRPRLSLQQLAEKTGFSRQTLSVECAALKIYGPDPNQPGMRRRRIPPWQRAWNTNTKKACTSCSAQTALYLLTNAGLCPSCNNKVGMTFNTETVCREAGEYLKLWAERQLTEMCATRNCPGCQIRKKVLQEGFIPTNIHIDPSLGTAYV